MDPEIGEIFRVGEVWESPKGTLYKVIAAGVGQQMVLRRGIRGDGPKRFRSWDRVSGWRLMCEDALSAYCKQWNIKP